MPSSSQGVQLAGAAAAGAALMYLYQKVGDAKLIRDVPTRSASTPSPILSRSAPSDTEKLMDDADLDQRMIRKAEGAILNRTSRLIVVVERCTVSILISILLIIKA